MAPTPKGMGSNSALETSSKPSFGGLPLVAELPTFGGVGRIVVDSLGADVARERVEIAGAERLNVSHLRPPPENAESGAIDEVAPLRLSSDTIGPRRVVVRGSPHTRPE